MGGIVSKACYGKNKKNKKQPQAISNENKSKGLFKNFYFL